MVLSAEGSVWVDAKPREVLELVLDLRAYAVLDPKIVKVYENPPVSPDGHTFIVFRGSMRGIRSPKQRQTVELDRWQSVTFESAGPWLANRFVWMKGGFAVEPADGGALVTHSYKFRFMGPFGPLMERYARDWLPQDLQDELQRIKTHFKRRAAGLPPPQRPHRPQAPTEEDRTRAKVRFWRLFIGG